MYPLRGSLNDKPPSFVGVNNSLKGEYSMPHPDLIPPVAPWVMDVRILPADKGSKNIDYLGFVEAPLEEIQLLRIWCEQVLNGAYPITDQGFATLLMHLHRPNHRMAREYLIGGLKPGSFKWNA